ncbi:thioredoxin domain-containing protein [Leptolyngbyaceae cyanobacterium JSC-12]|nr:thioredoxin domain-containing protein [Leptolyngbyaceae cyanobacterium JSC-12]
MGSSITVDQTNFAVEVLEKSHQKPVLVDFFATWCGPCKMLKPMLEALVQEYDVVLAKVDIDENPELAQTYGVQGVPDVRIVMDGVVNEGFVGVLPEPQLRQLMAQLNLKSELESALEELYDKAAIGNVESAQASLEQLLERYPDRRELWLEAANFFIETNQPERAKQLLNQIQPHEKEYMAHVNTLRAILFFKQIAAETTVASDLDTNFQQAAQQVLNQDYQSALESLLDIVMRDRTYRNDGARKAMVEVFNLLGDHPLVTTYRKRLMTALY